MSEPDHGLQLQILVPIGAGVVVLISQSQPITKSHVQVESDCDIVTGYGVTGEQS